ncbi:glycosyltransferase, partial [uncultured Flavobacterium sp.]|uniref:glycosyltransferase n=1 Tax=uncultured Flavobacterium sp. TaxID=165435 RepID=UPI0025CB88BC
FINKKYEEFFNALDSEVKSKIFSFKKVDFKSMLHFLRGAKAAVYPSMAEGFGIPPLESLAAKIPTITSNATAMSDFKFLSEHSFNPAHEEEFDKKLLDILKLEESKIPALVESLKIQYSWSKSAQIFNQAINDYQKRNI